MSPGAKRLLAIVVAVTLVGVALGVRAVIDGGDGGDSSSDPGSDGGRRSLLCASELASACRELARTHHIDLTIEPAGLSADRIARAPDDQVGDLGFDGWLTLARSAEIARDRRARASLAPAIGAPSAAIGRSPLVIGIWKDRAGALAPRCPNRQITWRCIGDAAGRSWTASGGLPGWGSVKPGHADPATTGVGLAVIGQEATSYFGRADLTLDDYSDDAFLEWFGRLENSVRGIDAFEQMLVGGPAAYDMVGTTEADAAPALARATPDLRAKVDLLYPAPVATADVVYAPAVGADGADPLRDLLTGDDGRAALARSGWRVEGAPRAPGVPSTPPLPPRDHLPDAGSLEALLQTWREVTA